MGSTGVAALRRTLDGTGRAPFLETYSVTPARTVTDSTSVILGDETARLSILEGCGRSRTIRIGFLDGLNRTFLGMPCFGVN